MITCHIIGRLPVSGAVLSGSQDHSSGGCKEGGGRLDCHRHGHTRTLRLNACDQWAHGWLTGDKGWLWGWQYFLFGFAPGRGMRAAFSFPWCHPVVSFGKTATWGSADSPAPKPHSFDTLKGLSPAPRQEGLLTAMPMENEPHCPMARLSANGGSQGVTDTK